MTAGQPALSPCWTMIPRLKKERLSIFWEGALHIHIYHDIFPTVYSVHILITYILPFFGIQMCQPQLPAGLPVGQALRDSNKADLEKRLLEEQVSDSKAGTEPSRNPSDPDAPAGVFCWKVDHEKCRQWVLLVKSTI